VQITVKRGIGRYTAIIVGLGAAGVAIGWLGWSEDLPTGAQVTH
jgi:hypothetical protein